MNFPVALRRIYRTIIDANLRIFLVWIAAAALVLRLGVVLVFGNTTNPEMYEHGAIARNLYNGHGFSFHATYIYTSLLPERQELMRQPPQFETANQPPVNPYIIYAVFLLLGDTSAALIVLMLLNCVLSAATPVVIYYTAKLIAKEDEARWSAVLMTFFLPGAFSVATFSGTALYTLVGVGVLYYVLQALNGDGTTVNIRNAGVLGIGSGLLTMLRSEFMLLGLLLMLYVVVVRWRQQGMMPALQFGAIGFIIFALCIAPWTIRNYHLFGRFIPTVSRPWHEIWRGNNALFEGSAMALNGRDYYLAAGDTLISRHISVRLDSLQYDQSFEPNMNDVFKDETIQYIRQHPWRTIQMTIEKALFLWTFEPYYSRSRNPLYLVFILPLLCCSFVGMIEYWRRSRASQYFAAWICLMGIYLYYTGIFSVTFILPRYQIYFISLMMPVAGLGSVRIARQIAGWVHGKNLPGN